MPDSVLMGFSLETGSSKELDGFTFDGGGGYALLEAPDGKWTRVDLSENGRISLTWGANQPQGSFSCRCSKNGEEETSLTVRRTVRYLTACTQTSALTVTVNRVEKSYEFHVDFNPEGVRDRIRRLT